MRKPEMPEPEVREGQMQIVRAAEVRRSLTVPGDIKSEVAFQNDINALLARFDELKVPWLPLSGTLPASVVADTTPVPSIAKPSRRPRRQDAPAPRFRVVGGGAAPTIDLLAVTPSPVRVAAPKPGPTIRIPGPTTPVPVPISDAADSGPIAAPARVAGGRGPRRR
jgi:hypothetical protein